MYRLSIIILCKSERLNLSAQMLSLNDKCCPLIMGYSLNRFFFFFDSQLVSPGTLATRHIKRTLITFLFNLRIRAWLTYGGRCRICHEPYLLNQRQLKLLHLNIVPSSSITHAFRRIRCEGIVATMVTGQSTLLIIRAFDKRAMKCNVGKN